MEKFTFDNIPDPNQNEELRETIKIIQEMAKQITDSFNEILAPVIIELKNRAVQPLAQRMNAQFLEMTSEFANSVQISESAIAALEYLKSLSPNQVEHKIELTNDDIEIAKEFDINIEDCNQSNDLNNKKCKISIGVVISIIALLFDVILGIGNKIDSMESSKQSQEIIEEISELNEQQEKANQLLEILISKLPENEASPDEIDNLDLEE